MNDTTFYAAADAALQRECRRLRELTDALDRAPAEKEKRIAEYKCTKYRLASVLFIHSILYNNNLYRGVRDLKDSHYLTASFDEIFKKRADHLSLYESAPEEEKPDYSLYYLAAAFIDEETEMLESRLPLASDWEKVELEERLGGLGFARACLDEAWQKRKDGIK